MRFGLLAIVLGFAGGHAAELKLNQLQAIGSHNSYHLAPPPALLDRLGAMNPDWAEAWDYSHPPLVEQLDAGVRQFELDIFSDEKGGLFAQPLGLRLMKIAGATTPPFDPEGLLKKPGFKVLHIPDADYGSQAPTLSLALSQMLAWSGKHPRHLPVMILLECKDQPQPPLPTKPEKLTRERLLALEKEVLSVIPAERILRPDDVRGKHPTLREAVLGDGWPSIESLRGKFLFALDNTDAVRDRYLEDNLALEGRLIFVSAPDEQHPAAGWFKCNDPVREFDHIRQLVEAGFLVRTRSDQPGSKPLQQTKAIDSGAQWVSSDRFAAGHPQRVSLPGGLMVRSNPASGGDGQAIEP
ncbi:Ca2+-dependent phosphoinositide-specific phospholipase C [Luteolibacter marinus]|uniref:Ca2+-dependent phosphoinositide-specific phospholipase C n=1 Tax=Luteolibacter marinus TaxID=2776705 RepID=UPI001868EF4E|nr:Ca2+-dependent phosphoinositide-specific phospholipase C [Luteolibacter marinus]